MNSDDLCLFARVVKAGSVSRAALDLGVDQSTISRRIGLLESALGVRLLHRSGRGVVPTERGTQLLDYAHAVAGLLDEAQQSMADDSARGPSHLAIAAQPTIAKMLFGHVGQRLRQRFPNIRLRFIEALVSSTLEKLADGELDLAIMYIPEQPGSLQFDPLFSEAVRLIAPANFPLSGNVIAMGALAEVPLILPSTHHGLRLLVESHATRQGFSANIAVECNGSIALFTSLVQQGCGCALLPEAAVMDEIAAGRLKSYRIEGGGIRRQVGLVQGKNRVRPAGLWEAAQLIKAQVVALVQSGAWPDAELDDSLARQEPLERR